MLTHPNPLKYKARIELDGGPNLSSIAASLDGLSVPEFANTKISAAEDLRVHLQITRARYESVAGKLKSLASRIWSQHETQVHLDDTTSLPVKIALRGTNRKALLLAKAEIDCLFAKELAERLAPRDNPTKQTHCIRLTRPKAYREALQGGLERAKAAAGSANVTLDDYSDPPAIVVRGDTTALHKVMRCLDADEKSPDSKTAECPICCDESEDIVRMPDCQHIACKDCFVAYWTIDKEAKFPLRCIQTDCERLVEMEQLRSVLSRSQLEEVLNGAVKDHISRRPDKFTQCPGVDCSYNHPLSDERDHQTLCPKCLNEICTKCRVIYHHDETCAAYQKRTAEDEQFARWKESAKAKTCKKYVSPRHPIHSILELQPADYHIRCNAVVQKLDGCDNMTCYLCKSNFCWHCMEIFPTHAAVYGHMEREHGGFFADPEEQAQQMENLLLEEMNDEDVRRFDMLAGGGDPRFARLGPMWMDNGEPLLGAAPRARDLQEEMLRRQRVVAEQFGPRNGAALGAEEERRARRHRHRDAARQALAERQAREARQQRRELGDPLVPGDRLARLGDELRAQLVDEEPLDAVPNELAFRPRPELMADVEMLGQGDEGWHAWIAQHPDLALEQRLLDEADEQNEHAAALGDIVVLDLPGVEAGRRRRPLVEPMDEDGVRPLAAAGADGLEDEQYRPRPEQWNQDVAANGPLERELIAMHRGAVEQAAVGAVQRAALQLDDARRQLDDANFQVEEHIRAGRRRRPELAHFVRRRHEEVVFQEEGQVEHRLRVARPRLREIEDIGVRLNEALRPPPERMNDLRNADERLAEGDENGDPRIAHEPDWPLEQRLLDNADDQGAQQRVRQEFVMGHMHPGGGGAPRRRLDNQLREAVRLDEEMRRLWRDADELRAQGALDPQVLDRLRNRGEELARLADRLEDRRRELEVQGEEARARHQPEVANRVENAGVEPAREAGWVPVNEAQHARPQRDGQRVQVQVEFEDVVQELEDLRRWVLEGPRMADRPWE